MVIVTRNVDLSVGSVLGLSAYVVGDFFKNNPHAPSDLGFVLGIAVGAVVGAVNGAIVTFFRVPSLVVTLAIAVHRARWLDAVIVNGDRIDLEHPARLPEDRLQDRSSASLADWLAVIVVIIVAIAPTP